MPVVVPDFGLFPEVPLITLIESAGTLCPFGHGKETMAALMSAKEQKLWTRTRE